MEQDFSPEQVADLLAIVRRHLAGVAELQQPLVSLEQEGMEAFTLLCHGLVSLNDWPEYLELRERLLLPEDEARYLARARTDIRIAP